MTLAERKARFLQGLGGGAPKTPETPIVFDENLEKGSPQNLKTPVLGVLGVYSYRYVKKQRCMDAAPHEAVANDADPGLADPDRDCWPADPNPDTAAMNAAEIGAFTNRLRLFTGRGTPHDIAETLADKLMRRDREGDDRRLCLECRHLRNLHCTEWQRAALSTSNVSGIARKLQRCPAFTEGKKP